MTYAFLGIFLGLILLVWSANRFIEGSACVARHLRMSPLLIGMVVVGFGTSVPEMIVSALASSQGNPGVALGNAYGSNIVNIALILGITAIISPVAVHPQVLRKELPLLAGVAALAALQIWDGELTRIDAMVLLGTFFCLMGWTIWQGMHQRSDALEKEMALELANMTMPIRLGIVWLVTGLVLLVVSSQVLVWGATEIAIGFGVSDLIIGLTVVAVGTSLPELASSVIASLKGEHDIALGNVLGSNLFNTLVVVGIAGSINPMTVSSEVLYRDILVMSLLTLSLFFFGASIGGNAQIKRYAGFILVFSYLGYLGYLLLS